MGLAVAAAQLMVSPAARARAPGIVETLEPSAPGERAISLTSTGEASVTVAV